MSAPHKGPAPGKEAGLDETVNLVDGTTRVLRCRRCGINLPKHPWGRLCYGCSGEKFPAELSVEQLADELTALNDRILKRLTEAIDGEDVPIAAPRWASRVIDTGREVVALHKDTAEPYPLDVHGDLDIEDHATLLGAT